MSSSLSIDNFPSLHQVKKHKEQNGQAAFLTHLFRLTQKNLFFFAFFMSRSVIHEGEQFSLLPDYRKKNSQISRTRVKKVKIWILNVYLRS